MYKNILIPIDISHPEIAIPVLRKARSLADEGAKITALYVMSVIPSHISGYVTDEALAESRKQVEDSLAELCVSAGMHVDTLIKDGNPGAMIVGVAKELDCDLIVVRSHSPGLQDYLIGSTAGKVVRHAKCSVLVVR